MIQRILKDRKTPEVLKELGEDIAVVSFNGRPFDLAPLLLNTVKNFKDNASEIAWKSFARCLVGIVLEES